MPDSSPIPEHARFNGSLRSVAKRLVYLRRALELVWSATRTWTAVWIGLVIIQGLLPAAAVHLTKVLVDRVAAAVGAGLAWESIAPVLTPAVAMGVILILIQVLQSVSTWIRTAQGELLQDHVKALIHRKASSVDLAFYDMPEYFDQMSRANGEASTRTLSILQNAGALAQHTITLLSVAALLIPYGVWLPVVLLAGSLPALVIFLHHHRLHHAWWERTTEERRWAEYYDQVLVHPFLAAEVRLFGLHDPFHEAYTKLRGSLRTGRLQLLRRQQHAHIGAALLALGVTVGALAWMGARVLSGEGTLGDLALIYQALNQGQMLLRNLLSSVGQLYADTLFLKHLFSFLELPEHLPDPKDPKPIPTPLTRGITFEDVSFRYPGSEQYALRHFNLSIPSGKVVALVGANGAGKTTVAKLLCRLYDPEEGRITWDGVDLRAMKAVELRKQISVLFQYYVNYAGTVEDNIVMGDHGAPREPARLTAAAEAGGADDVVERLPNGYRTLLGKQFKGGMDLSGGQWQRLALARAFYRKAPLLVLDEPTSFMDAWAESRWLQHFRGRIEDRTVVLITHRFSTAMRADLIYVVDEGRVVESGTHDELLIQGGRYATSWHAQMEERHSEADTDATAEPNATVTT